MNLLVRRQVHLCQLNTINCLTCNYLLNKQINPIINNLKYCNLLLPYEKLSTNYNLFDIRKCSSPPLQMTFYYDELTNSERVFHSNYPVS